jgi:hypothetical protein
MPMEALNRFEIRLDRTPKQQKAEIKKREIARNFRVSRISPQFEGCGSINAFFARALFGHPAFL